MSREPIYTCQSCGRVMRKAEDFGGGRVGAPYCSRCADEFGFLRGLSDVLDGMHASLETQLDYSPKEARRIAAENIHSIPAWMKREKHMQNTSRILITDIGSTTTKALLLTKQNDRYDVTAIRHASTTVERPYEDVRIGVWNAVKGLEDETGAPILTQEATPDNLTFEPGVLYLTTSSAGGGLQILVVGLTVVDSASSARRAAYGAGGALLDTFAIDDNRSAVEQMMAMQALRPDIILFSGGIDGGAVSGIVRLAEVLSFSDPQPKFGASAIPLVFAGNKDAVHLVNSVFSDNFELHIAPNLRPTMTEENLEPARETIHRLFMDKVMEQAPKYDEVKKIVADDIIPTPMGVIKSLQLLSRTLDENIVAVDIGGATTDVFSNILGQYYRTVSANLGMSYSLSNVLAETGWENIARWLPASIDETTARDYIGNKMLHPERNPQAQWEYAIEHACAREALRLAQGQHMQMHFNTEKVGFLDKLKTQNYDKFVETMYVEKKLEERRFRDDSINILIGAGGVITAASPEQAAMIIIDGLQPRGVTEIWRDRRFISPHLGKLSDMDEQLALQLLVDEAYQRLVTVIRPLWRKTRKGDTVGEFTVGGQQMTIKADNLMWLPATGRTRKVSWSLQKGFALPDIEEIETDLNILIDTRIKPSSRNDVALELAGLASVAPEGQIEYVRPAIDEEDEVKVRLALPYPGDILVKQNDHVTPDTLVGENRHDPPKIFILSLFKDESLDLDSNSMRNSLEVKIGEEIRPGQKLLDITDRSLLANLNGKARTYHSPIRGMVEDINYESGVIIAREIQDYSTKPVKVNVAAKLGVDPKHVKGYLKRRKGDFVYAGAILGSRLLDKEAKATQMFCHAPSTGTITDIDLTTGKLTIKYEKEPFKLFAGVSGEVAHVTENRAVTIHCNGEQIKGVIGFGPHGWGELVMAKGTEMPLDAMGKVIACMQPVDAAFMKAAEKAGARGVVAPSIAQIEAVRWLGEEIGVALTGSETVSCPLVLLEGFGDASMNQQREKVFADHLGEMCYLQAATQIRAGVQRPRVILYRDK